MEQGKDRYLDQQALYTLKNVFFVPQESRWSYIIQNAKQNDIALNTIKKQKPSLKGALPDNYYSRFGINVSKLAAHLDEIPINRNSLFYTIRPRYHRPIITSIVERLLQLLKYADMLLPTLAQN